VRRVSLTSLAVTAVLAVSVPGAQASNITVEHVVPMCNGGDECRYFMEEPYDNYTLTGAPGEANRLTVTGDPRDPGPIRFRDDGATIGDIGNCTRVDEHEVTCIGRIGVADGGDMNDVITSDGIDVSAVGGPGDDELIGGDGPDTLTGGPGNDVLRGNGGFDALSDGDDGAAGDADVYDGGPGDAKLSYVFSTGGVTVDLSKPSAGQGEIGENDRVSGVTAVEGGAGPDNLFAAAEGSTLDGGAGNDVLTGGPGPDQIDAGPGRNSTFAGGGNDKIGSEVRIHSQSRVSCGDGADQVELPSRRDLVGADCDRVIFYVDLSVTSLQPLRSLSAPVVSAHELSCFENGRPGLELRVAATYRRPGLPRAGTLLGRRVASRRACRPRSTLSVRLSPTGQRLLRRFRVLPVDVRINDPGNRERYIMALVAP
jgi:hypothetical protein